MFSIVRPLSSAFVLVLVASGLGAQDRPIEIDGFNPISLRFKEPVTPAVILPVQAESALPAAAAEVPAAQPAARQEATLPAAATEIPATQPAASQAAITTEAQVHAVEQVQYAHSEAPGSIVPKYTLAQNPLDDLQKELQRADADAESLGGIFDELNEVTTPPPTDATPSATGQAVNQRSPIRSILGESAPSDSSTRSDSRSLIDPRMEPDADETIDDMASSLNQGPAAPGLRDDAYYQSLGMPKQVRRANRSDIPLTMGNIFGGDDEYDPACVRRYCEQMWQCAGGRGQNAFGRSCRDILRSRQLRQSRNCGSNMPRKDFKCRKLTDQGNCSPDQGLGLGPYQELSDPYFHGGEHGMMMKQDGQIIYVEPHNAGPYGTEALEDLREIGELQAPIPPATLP